MIRVLLVDDQTLLREGFRRLLEMEAEDVVIVGTASDGQEAIDRITQLEHEQMLPDVILMDIRMPRLSGVEATRQIHTRWPAIGVVMLTTFDDEESILAGLRAGAKGYLLKDASVEELVTAIHAARRGEAPIQPSVARKLVEHLTRQDATPQVEPHEELFHSELTDREREIVAMLGRGASNREISEQLFITEGTVKNHVSNILSKLGLRDRTQVAIFAREHGML